MSNVIDFCAARTSKLSQQAQHARQTYYREEQWWRVVDSADDMEGFEFEETEFADKEAVVIPDWADYGSREGLLDAILRNQYSWNIFKKLDEGEYKVSYSVWERQEHLDKRGFEPQKGSGHRYLFEVDFVDLDCIWVYEVVITLTITGRVFPGLAQAGAYRKSSGELIT